MFSDFSVLCVQPTASISQAIACIDRNQCGVVLVVDEEYHLLDTITDGDVRRAILTGLDLDAPVSVLQSRKAGSPYRQPVTAPVGTEPSTLLRMMEERSVRQIPLLDDDQRVVGLITLDDFVPNRVLPVKAVVMAGGVGSRLRPLTDDLPKPMLPVGDRPLLELTIEQMRQAGIQRINLTTHYKGAIIAEHFGDGRDFGVEIHYVEEDQPLGTAGALSLLSVSNEPLLVVNGDVLTRVDFQAMLDFHHEHKADMTVAVRQHEVRLPHGVVETDGTTITGILEKPVLRHFMNAGIYLLNPQMCRFIPSGHRYDMTDLICRLIVEGCRVISFPIHEYWLDIGQVEDYEKALSDFENRAI